MAGDGAHRDIERGKLGPDRIRGVVVSSAASHAWHAQISQQNRKRKAACIFVPYVRGDSRDNQFIFTCDICFLYEYTYRTRTYIRVSGAGNIISASCEQSSTTAASSTRSLIHSRCCKRSSCTAVHRGCLGGWVGYWVGVSGCVARPFFFCLPVICCFFKCTAVGMYVPCKALDSDVKSLGENPPFLFFCFK